MMNKLPTIYLDLDDTLVSFFETANYILKKYGSEEWKHHSWENESDRWDVIAREDKFWYNLPWLHEANELWNYTAIYDPHILSAVTPHMKSCRPEKLLWIQDNLHINNIDRIHLVDREEKKNYAISEGRQNLLIDDYKVNCEEFIEAGGIAILHKNVQQTIEELKTLGY